LNAAAAFVAAGRAAGLVEGVGLAAAAIDTSRATTLLGRLRAERATSDEAKAAAEEAAASEGAPA